MNGRQALEAAVLAEVTCKSSNDAAFAHSPELLDIWLQDLAPNSALTICHDNNLCRLLL